MVSKRLSACFGPELRRLEARALSVGDVSSEDCLQPSQMYKAFFIVVKYKSV